MGTFGDGKEKMKEWGLERGGKGENGEREAGR